MKAGPESGGLWRVLAIGEMFVTLPAQVHDASMWPTRTGTAIPVDDWRSRMWVDTWA
jgi:hypothetical protein